MSDNVLKVATYNVNSIRARLWPSADPALWLLDSGESRPTGRSLPRLRNDSGRGGDGRGEKQSDCQAWEPVCK